MEKIIISVIFFFLSVMTIQSQDSISSFSGTINEYYRKESKYDAVVSSRNKELRDAHVIITSKKSVYKRLCKMESKVFSLWLSGRRFVIDKRINKLTHLEFLRIDTKRRSIFKNGIRLPENILILSILGLEAFDSIPYFIYDHKNLKGLEISLNSMSAVSNNISNLSELEYLTIYINEIDSLPDWLFELKSLKGLYFYTDKESTQIRLDERFLSLNSLTSIEISIDLSESIDFLYTNKLRFIQVAECSSTENITATTFPNLKKLIINNITSKNLKILKKQLPDTKVCREICRNRGLMYD